MRRLLRKWSSEARDWICSLRCTNDQYHVAAHSEPGTWMRSPGDAVYRGGDAKTLRSAHWSAVRWEKRGKEVVLLLVVYPPPFTSTCFQYS